MKTDVELLRDQVRQKPEDEILLAAFADALIEAGEHKQAALVIEYRNRKRLLSIHNAQNNTDSGNYERHLRECDRIWFLLGLRGVRVGDYLSYDDEGRVFPVVNGRWSRQVGRAISPSENGVVRVQTTHPIYDGPGRPTDPQPEWELEVSRL